MTEWDGIHMVNAYSIVSVYIWLLIIIIVYDASHVMLCYVTFFESFI